MQRVDVIVIGGGIAGLSAAAKLAQHGSVAVFEREPQPGYHSSGRSATYCHLGIGDHAVRAMTVYGTKFFAEPPADFTSVPLSRRGGAMLVVRDGQEALLEKTWDGMQRVGGDAVRLDASEIAATVPVLRTGGERVTRAILDRGGRRLDGDALLQGFVQMLRRNGGTLHTDVAISAIERDGDGWTVRGAGDEAWTAPVLVNAAGAWGDAIALRAGVQPLGLRPLRRTIIHFDPPAGVDASNWPFVRSLADEFYFLPEAGGLLASPADEIETEPCDARPEEYDVALAAWRIEEATTMEVRRIKHSWAGLRTFSPDRVPVAGFATDAKGFFWLVGQGGYGLQTAPAMSDAVEALIAGRDWPSGLTALDVQPAHLSPARFAVR